MVKHAGGASPSRPVPRCPDTPHVPVEPVIHRTGPTRPERETLAMFFGKLLPREGNFFELFNQHANHIVTAAHAFAQLVRNYNDTGLREKYNRDVDAAEAAADSVNREVNRLTDLGVKSAERVKDAVALLHDIGDAKTAAAALKTCEEIDQLESDADRVMRAAMSKLFREEPDVREVIKLKAIYELLETVTDKCEDVAKLIEGVILENS